jgi:hypothetical protein
MPPSGVVRYTHGSEAMKIRFTQAATARLEFSAGDELTVRRLTPSHEALLLAKRIDGTAVARLVEDEEIADARPGESELAIKSPRGRHRGPRDTTVSE